MVGEEKSGNSTKVWAAVVIAILKTELAKRRINYIELEAKLAAIGVKETPENIRNKLSRGTFSAIFLVQCLRAIGVTQLSLDDSYFSELEANSL